MLGASLTVMEWLPTSIFAREASFAYVVFNSWLAEIYVPSRYQTAARSHRRRPLTSSPFEYLLVEAFAVNGAGGCTRPGASLGRRASPRCRWTPRRYNEFVAGRTIHARRGPALVGQAPRVHHPVDPGEGGRSAVEWAKRRMKGGTVRPPHSEAPPRPGVLHTHRPEQARPCPPIRTIVVPRCPAMILVRSRIPSMLS
jgi:hypothetical protein